MPFFKGFQHYFRHLPWHVSYSSLNFYDFLFVVHLRSSVSEKAPGKSLALQLVQIKLCRDHALAVAVHGPDHFAGTVRNKGGTVKLQGRFLVSVCLTRCHLFKTHTVCRDHRHQVRRGMALHAASPVGHTVHGEDRLAADGCRVE